MVSQAVGAVGAGGSRRQGTLRPDAIRPRVGAPSPPLSVEREPIRRRQEVAVQAGIGIRGEIAAGDGTPRASRSPFPVESLAGAASRSPFRVEFCGDSARKGDLEGAPAQREGPAPTGERALACHVRPRASAGERPTSARRLPASAVGPSALRLSASAVRPSTSSVSRRPVGPSASSLSRRPVGPSASALSPPQPASRWARLSAEMIACIEARVIDPSIPTPQKIRSPISHSTYAAAREYSPSVRACSA